MGDKTTSRSHRWVRNLFWLGLGIILLASNIVWADPSGRTTWVPPSSGYRDEPGSADWGWPACTCNPADYVGDYCATNRADCSGVPYIPPVLGGVWHWVTVAGYWQSLPVATVSSSLSCTSGANGWCVTNALLSITGSEPVSGYSITAIDGDRDGTPFSIPGASANLLILDTTPSTFTYRAVSSFGDSSYASSALVKVDTAAPATTASLSGLLGANSWFVGPVTVSLSPADATSGVAGTTLDGSPYAVPVTYSAEGSTTISYFSTE